MRQSTAIAGLMLSLAGLTALSPNEPRAGLCPAPGSLASIAAAAAPGHAAPGSRVIAVDASTSAVPPPPAVLAPAPAAVPQQHPAATEAYAATIASALGITPDDPPPQGGFPPPDQPQR